MILLVVPFDDRIKCEDFDFDKILIDENSYQNILVYIISYKTLMDAPPNHMSFNKIYEFVRVYDGTRYLLLFWGQKYDFIYNSIRYLIQGKSSITYVIFHYYAKIKVDSFDSLPLEKRWHFLML